MEGPTKFFFDLFCSLPFGLRSRLNNTFEKLATHPYWHLEIIKKMGYYPDLVLDIGAYQGEWTNFAHRIFPKSDFLLIEAQESKRKYLDNVAKKSSKISYEIALLGKTASPQVPFYEMETGSSIYEEQSNAAREVKYLPMKTLDEVINTSNRKNVFIKLDVQGAELDILSGGEKSRSQVDFILLETSLLDYNLNAPLIHEVIAQMAEWDYLLFDLCGVHRKKDNKVLFQVDLLFINKGSSFREKANNFRDNS